MKRILFFSLLVMLTSLTAACGSAAAPAPELPYARQEQAVLDGGFAAATVVAAAPDLGQSAQTGTPVQQIRIIIYTGDVELVVADTGQAVKAITELADEMGGFVAGANIYHTDNIARGRMTIRVPAESYQQTLQRLRDLAVRVERESSNTEDVTEEFVDLEARQANLERTEAALQELLETRQETGRTEDILEVHRELTGIRGQIEQIQGRLNYLSRAAALSTITIELTPDALVQPITVAGWQPGGVAREALRTLIKTLQGLANFLIWMLIFVLPIMLLFLIPIVVVIWLIRRWQLARSKRKQAQAEAADITDDENNENENS